MIPLRPELIEFMLAESLGRLASCSKTLRTDVRETNAWTLLAAVQCPPQKAPTSESRERDAISRVASHMLRRRLAANLSIFAPNAPPPPPELRDNFTDFTYFLRIEDNGTLVWEGDLAADTARFDNDDYDESVWGSVRLVAPGSMRASICAVEGLATYLANNDRDDEEEWDDSYLNRIKLSMVAVREADSAMVSIGCFKLNEIKYDEDPLNHSYIFEAQHAVFSSKEGDDMYVPFELKANVRLDLIRRPRGRATVGALYMCMGFHVGEPNQQNDYDTLDDYLNRVIFQITLNHLAGSQYWSRERVLSSIKYWYGDPPAQTLTARIIEGHEGIWVWLRSGALGSSTQFADDIYTVIRAHAASRQQLVSRPWDVVADLLQLETLPTMVQEDFKRAWEGLKLEVEAQLVRTGYYYI